MKKEQKINDSVIGGNTGSKDGRARAWTFIVYPDSAPSNWVEILDSKMIPWVQSPLHDPDITSADEDERRKKHWHCQLWFEGKKSYDQVKEIIKELNCTVPKVVHNIRSLTRYFLHLDHPSKQQFALSDIIPHLGADVKDYLINKSDKYFYIKEMINYIIDNEITEFWTFSLACADFHPEWFELLCDNSAFFINLFIKSFRHDPEGATKKARAIVDSVVSDQDPKELSNS